MISKAKDCQNNFSVFVGTIFENTKIALARCFSAMYLISSHQLARDIDVTQKTTWHILHKGREINIKVQLFVSCFLKSVLTLRYTAWQGQNE